MDIDVNIKDFIESRDGLSEQDIAVIYKMWNYIELKNFHKGQGKSKSE